MSKLINLLRMITFLYALTIALKGWYYMLTDLGLYLKERFNIDE